MNTHFIDLLGFFLKRTAWTEQKFEHPSARSAATMLQQCSLIMLLLLAPVSATSLCGASEENKKWSFNFRNASISDVLDELTRTTGVHIFYNHLSDDKTVNKRYESQTLDKIVKDLFKGQNTGFVWHQIEEGTDALDIWVFDGSSGQSGGFSRIERSVTRTPNSPARYGRKTPKPVEKKDEDEETEEAEDDENDSPSESSELNDESEKGDAASDGDSGKEPAAVEEDEPDDESDEGTAEESPVPIKRPGLE